MSEPTITPPAPGVYADVPFAEYFRWNAASSSRLSLLVQSPAHLRASLDGKSEDTTSLRIGRAAHMAILEPEKFGAEFARAPEGDGRTTAVREAKAALEASGKVALSPAEWDRTVGIRQAVRSHPSAWPLLSGEGRSELSLVWVDPTTGVTCKARHDRHSPLMAGGAIVDVKTTRDASRSSFEKAIFGYGYHRQAAFYAEGAEQCGLPTEHSVIVAVENEAPFAVAVYRLSDAALDAGWEEVKALLGLYGRCQATNQWPGYPTEVQDVSLPDWAWGASQHIAERATA